jgi:hypothetical protein
MTRKDHLCLGIKRRRREPCRDRGVLDSGMSQPLLHKRQISTGIEQVRCGLDHGMGHLASVRPENNQRRPPIKVETKGRPRHP